MKMIDNLENRIFILVVISSPSFYDVLHNFANVQQPEDSFEDGGS